MIEVLLHTAETVIIRGPFESVTLGGLNADLLVAGDEKIAMRSGNFPGLWETPDGVGIGAIAFVAGSNEALAKAKSICDALNAGTLPSDAVMAVGLDPDDDVFGEDLGDECLDIDDSDNDVVDLGWHNETHYQVRRTSSRQPWGVEVMQRPYEPKENE